MLFGRMSIPFSRGIWEIDTKLLINKKCIPSFYKTLTGSAVKPSQTGYCMNWLNYELQTEYATPQEDFACDSFYFISGFYRHGGNAFHASPDW